MQDIKKRKTMNQKNHSQNDNYPSAVNRTFIKHDYHDHSAVTLQTYLKTKLDEMTLEDAVKGEKKLKLIHCCSRGAWIPFPTKLHLVISIAEREGFDNIVSW